MHAEVPGDADVTGPYCTVSQCTASSPGNTELTASGTTALKIGFIFFCWFVYILEFRQSQISVLTIMDYKPAILQLPLNVKTTDLH